MQIVSFIRNRGKRRITMPAPVAGADAAEE